MAVCIIAFFATGCTQSISAYARSAAIKIAIAIFAFGIVALFATGLAHSVSAHARSAANIIAIAVLAVCISALVASVARQAIAIATDVADAGRLLANEAV